MKRIFALITLTAALLAGAAFIATTSKPAHAQLLCHDEFICTPMGGCRWVTVCR